MSRLSQLRPAAGARRAAAARDAQLPCQPCRSPPHLPLLPPPELGTSLKQLAQATAALADANADTERAKARSQAMTHEVARIGQLEAVEQQPA